MKKLILSLSLMAFLGGSIYSFAGTIVNTNVQTEIQDGKKKAKATKKENCDTDKKVKSKKEGCQGNDALKSKSCCSHGKTNTSKAKKPEKK